MSHRNFFAAIVSATVIQSTFAANILIVNGSSTTSEPGTTSEITSHLQATCATGNIYTVTDTAPASLAGFDVIWDIRFSNVALSGSDQAAYVGFLQSGKRMFVMGENGLFASRNNSIFTMVNTLGGGALTFVTPTAATQTVNAPIASATLTSIAYSAPGGVTSPGTGAFLTQNGSTQGTAVGWATGTLSNAAAGSLTVVFDVNFMQPDAGAASTAFLSGLCGFVTTGGQPQPESPAPAIHAVPATSTWSLLAMLGALGLMGVGRLGFRRR